MLSPVGHRCLHSLTGFTEHGCGVTSLLQALLSYVMGELEPKASRLPTLSLGEGVLGPQLAGCSHWKLGDRDVSVSAHPRAYRPAWPRPQHVFPGRAVSEVTDPGWVQVPA